MAIFSPSSVKNIKDESVRNYLQELNENLTYMFNNLTPDDNNAKSVPKLTVVKGDDGESHIEVTQGGVVISASGISESDLIPAINSQLSVGTEGIHIQTNGKLTISTTQFSLDSSGNATFSGSISGGSINIGSGNFTVNSSGTVVANNITIGSTGSAHVGYFSDLLADYVHSLYIRTSQGDGIYFVDEDGTAPANAIYSYALGFLRPSDARLKENVINIGETDAVKLISDLRPVTFNYIGKERINAGFIAQEVEEVNELDAKLCDINKDGYYSIDYTGFVPIIVKALQYLIRKVDNE